MIPSSNGLIYSYRDFSPDDKIFRGFKTYEQITSIDYLDFAETTQEDSDKFIKENYDRFRKDVLNWQGLYGKYFFKEFCIRDIDLENGEFGYYIDYHISDWNEFDRSRGKDSRNISIDIYKLYYETSRFEIYRSYQIKAAHSFQLISDISVILCNITDKLKSGDIEKDDLIDSDIANLYVLPIYMRTTTSHSENIDTKAVTVHSLFNRYTRISNLSYNYSSGWTYEETINELNEFFSALYQFVAINYYMVYSTTHRVSERFYNPYTRKNSNTTIRTFFNTVKPTENVHKAVRLSLGKNGCSVPFYIHPDDEYKTIDRKLCDYRFSVSGHYTTVWCGSKKLGTLHPERRWIEPYEKNKNKPYAIVKEIKDNGNN